MMMSACSNVNVSCVAFSLLIALYFLSAEMFICNDKKTSTKKKRKVEHGKWNPVCFAIYVVCIFALWCLC